MKSPGFAAQPGQGEPIAGRDGRVSRAWANYFAQLALAQTGDDLRQLYEALAARVAELADGQTLRIIGRNSVNSSGTSVVEIQLVGDELAPGNTEYYGTGPDGAKGFFSIADAIEVEAADLVKVVGVDGVVILGLADVPDAGGGTLQKTAFDANGRKTGTSTATTDDLSEGSGNLYFTAARASAAAPVQSVNGETGDVVLSAAEVGADPAGSASSAVAAHVAEPDPHAQYQMKLPAGTTGQFLRGDSAWSNTLNGSFETTGDMLTAESFIGSDIYLGMAARAVGGIVAIRPNGPANAAGQFYVDSAGNMIPGGPCYPTADGAYPIGQTFARWTTVYALTGTINTSDAREKTLVRPFTPAELVAAAELGREIGVYQWLAMIAQKGDAARQHIGQTVQRAIAILESHGLDPFAYGFVCYDEWGPKEPVVTDSGMEVSPGVQGGSRYSFRMDELLAFIARGLVHRLDSVEQRLAAAGL